METVQIGGEPSRYNSAIRPQNRLDPFQIASPRLAAILPHRNRCRSSCRLPHGHAGGLDPECGIGKAIS